MHKTMKILSRSLTTVALGAALTVTSAGLASASVHHDSGSGRGNCASGRLSPFDYAHAGVGGYVTAASLTSVTVDSWNGTSTTFPISPTATYTEGGAPTTASSLVVGDRVQLQVSPSAPTTVTSINIELAFLFGTVTSVSGNTILIRDPQGFTRTILVGSATTYSQNGGTGSLSDIVTGSKILASGTVDTNGTSLDAVSIKIGSVGSTQIIRGSVTAFSASSVTVQGKGGTPTVFTLTTGTTFKDGKYTLSAANLSVGEKVSVEVNSSAATTALNVAISLTSVFGVVSSVTGNTVVVNGPQGFTRTIVLGSGTVYYDGHSAGSISDVVTGAHIIALGTVDTNQTSLDAVVVVVWAPVANPFPQVHIPDSQLNGNGSGHHHGGFGRQGSSARGRH
jgi:Domain of unknown function (DUF5666)